MTPPALGPGAVRLARLRSWVSPWWPRDVVRLRRLDDRRRVCASKPARPARDGRDVKAPRPTGLGAWNPVAAPARTNGAGSPYRWQAGT